MLVIAGGILLAVAALALLAVTLRYVVLALSAAFSLAIAAGAWLLLASGIGESWATATLVGGFAIWLWTANRDRLVRKSPAVSSPGPGKRLERKIS